MPGLYTDISIVAPSSARAASEVGIEITIENISNEAVHAVPGFLTIDGVDVPPFGIEDLRWLSPGQSYAWERSFIMPEKSVTVDVESWWENSQVLHKDNEAQQVVSLTTVALAGCLPLALIGLAILATIAAVAVVW